MSEWTTLIEHWLTVSQRDSLHDTFLYYLRVGECGG